jgi:hypothetical protein
MLFSEDFVFFNLLSRYDDRDLDKEALNDECLKYLKN